MSDGVTLKVADSEMLWQAALTRLAHAIDEREARTARRFAAHCALQLKDDRQFRAAVRELRRDDRLEFALLLQEAFQDASTDRPEDQADLRRVHEVACRLRRFEPSEEWDQRNGGVRRPFERLYVAYSHSEVGSVDDLIADPPSPIDLTSDPGSSGPSATFPEPSAPPPADADGAGTGADDHAVSPEPGSSRHRWIAALSWVVGACLALAAGAALVARDRADTRSVEVARHHAAERASLVHDAQVRSQEVAQLQQRLAAGEQQIQQAEAAFENVFGAGEAFGRELVATRDVLAAPPSIQKDMLRAGCVASLFEAGGSRVMCEAYVRRWPDDPWAAALRPHISSGETESVLE